MGLSSALASAMSGLRANQAALSIVSSNVANAQTPGYVVQTPNQIEVTTGDFGATAMTTGVSRELDAYVLNQLRTETGGSGYADQMANILKQLQNVYGTPGNSGTLEAALNKFTTALQALSTSSGASSAQTVALGAAQALATQLNVTTKGIQSLRSNVEQDLGNSARAANAAMQQIADINTKLQGLSPNDPSAATLMDQRDQAINTLSKYVDVRVTTDGSNQTNIYTTTGIQLVGAGLASEFSFASAGALSATSLYNIDPTKSGVGALNIKLPNGSQVDVVANNVVSSGQIAADLKLRDETLVQAQNQIDQLAATMASALSDKTTAGSTVSGPPAGFDLELAGALPGNTVNITYTDTATNTQRQITLVNVTDPAALPLQNATNANPMRIGVNFAGGMNAIASALNTALSGTHLSFSAAPSPATATTLRVTDDNTGLAKVNSASTTKTISSLTSGNPQLPLFTDGGQALYTGAITASGSQMTGLAGRIAVNTQLVADPTRMSVYNTSPVTPAGDTTRSDYLYSQLTSTVFSYSPQSGLGSATQPFTGSVSNFLQQFLSVQANAATQATQLQQGQSVVVSTLQAKFDSTSKVNLDAEMSNLIQLQNAYAANAHVMSVVQSMMNTLIQAQL
ncbi:MULTISPECIES: flagellar hook-associated protein FlgK [Bradyrhizobium]|uniref:flagellar hook-associated protein FlgK n=1 Tax=Bradyrhizobium TaxID=374 RepID=UPI00155E268E|nr:MULTISPECIES: flagellar hook-associated protein FlgK [Bradyrhizobium]MDD1518289.1 flagellar hook-associated protein FlgK [Bradyrhizobium sp. WBAH30]MDD1542086.1 flagellar hook-associated protein FlgK [Bradyrhizobium sp. WBAH41]MDD1556238.1 flagellar hook-associated protein FlgK [Bradyrhizobium sp. WBAH23]MDD1561921.1 flagellar hook-associated protein FlgK [Bradyrhizobium sp. WBAH33]MDD1589058.1 flagellar hook-associated protein FlgK [Bradyrhizobium sp. WBAH42]